jgi:hypothetical protein
VRRRSLLAFAASALSTLPFLRSVSWVRAAAASAAFPVEHDAVFAAVAAAVLPTSLGRARVDAVARSFRTWVEGYREGAELDHGYGHTRLHSTGPSPAAAYGLQLAALDRAARADAGTGFESLAPERQKALLEAALSSAGIDELPERPDGGHVAADLLAFFFRSAEANDVCYGAAIAREACRGLPGSDQPPKPLGKSG